MPDIDSLLIQRARQGDREAQVVIYDYLYPPIFRYFYYRLPDKAQAEDLASEVFVRMVAALPTYEDRGRPFIAWLYTLAHNLLADHYRQRGQVNQVSIEDDRLVSLAEGRGRGPAEVAEQHLTREDLAQALDCLTEDQRQVILLRFVEERDVPEIAAMMGRNERAIRSLQHRALAALGRLMEAVPD